MAALLAAHLQALAPSLAKQITMLRAKLTKLSKSEAEDAAARALAEEILAQLNLGDWATLIPELQQLLLVVAEDGIRVAFGQLGVTPTAEITEQVNEKAVAWATERAAELVGMRYEADGSLVENPNAEWAISATTREQLRGDVVRAIEDGTSTDDLAAQLEGSYGFSADRAETIARTELAAADIEGNLTAYRDSGVVGGKMVVLGSEHDDASECDCNDAAALGVVDIDDDFDGLGDPPYHPNCVCDVVPVLTSEMD